MLPLSWSEALAANNFHGGSSSGSSNSNSKSNSNSNSASTNIDTAVVNINANMDMDTRTDKEFVIPCDYIAETNLPTDIGHFRLRAYRVDSSDDSVVDFLLENNFMGKEPCAIYCTQCPPGTLGGILTDGDGELEAQEAVPVRIHDQCFTSEVFRSQRCDCKEQLRMALEYLQRNGGAIIYLQQEGRGIGLANKIAAYALQDAGMDTVEANVHLGFAEDCRQYGVVPGILKDMGIASIQLMTNNP